MHPRQFHARYEKRRLRQQVAFAWKHRAYFQEVAEHNLQVTIRRYQRADWTAPENQYRNAWTELAGAVGDRDTRAASTAS